MLSIKHYNCTSLYVSSYKLLGFGSTFRALESSIIGIITTIIANSRVLSQAYKILRVSHTLFHLISTTIQKISSMSINISVLQMSNWSWGSFNKLSRAFGIKNPDCDAKAYTYIIFVILALIKKTSIHKYNTKSTSNNRKKQVILDHQNLNFFMLQRRQWKWKNNPKNGRKFLEIIYLMKDL